MIFATLGLRVTLPLPGYTGLNRAASNGVRQTCLSLGGESQVENRPLKANRHCYGRNYVCGDYYGASFVMQLECLAFSMRGLRSVWAVSKSTKPNDFWLETG